MKIELNDTALYYDKDYLTSDGFKMVCEGKEYFLVFVKNKIELGRLKVQEVTEDSNLRNELVLRKISKLLEKK